MDAGFRLIRMKQKETHREKNAPAPVLLPAESNLPVETVKGNSKATTDLLQWSLLRLIGAGYGLFSRKAADPRWPEFIITAFVLKKYRNKNSFWFMIRHAMRGMRKHEIVAGDAKALIAKLIGSKPHQLHQLSGIYRAVREEQGAAVATAVTVEIIRITNQKRSEKLAWWKVRRKKTLTAQYSAKKKSAHRSKVHHTKKTTKQEHRHKARAP